MPALLSPLLLLLLPLATADYTAAIIQYSSNSPPSPTTESIIALNLLYYNDKAAEAAAKSADIITFPEWGLFGTSGPANHRETMAPFCEDMEDSSTLTKLKQIAVDNAIVVVANVCEKVVDDDQNELLYNTEVAIAADGTLLAKYHKMHPFFPKTFDTPPEEEDVTFEAFGVTFGLFVCYDLLHSTPQTALLSQGVRHFPYSVALPSLLLSKEYYQHWSKSNNATLLASNLGPVGGGGIFVRGEAVVHERADMVIATVAT